MKWQKKDNYYLQNGDYTICKVQVGEETFYELWLKSQCIKQGFMTSKDAIEYFKGMSDES